MAVTQSFNDLINRFGGGFRLDQPIWGEQTASTTTTLTSNDFAVLQTSRVGDTTVMPTLPAGVSAIVPMTVDLTTSIASMSVLVAKCTNLGSLDISGASGTFTDGSAMPTVTELGVSRVTSGAVMMEVTTVLNGTPGTITVTYVDQDGNGAETTAAHTLTASAAVRTCGTLLLNTTDWGVRDITAAARAAGTTPTGIIKFWGITPIALMAASPGQAGICIMDNLITSGFNWTKLGAADVIQYFVMSNASAKAIMGHMVFMGDST